MEHSFDNEGQALDFLIFQLETLQSTLNQALLSSTQLSGTVIRPVLQYNCTKSLESDRRFYHFRCLNPFSNIAERLLTGFLCSQTLINVERSIELEPRPSSSRPEGQGALSFITAPLEALSPLSKYAIRCLDSRGIREHSYWPPYNQGTCLHLLPHATKKAALLDNAEYPCKATCISKNLTGFLCMYNPSGSTINRTVQPG